jgi:hypothetical protein
MGESFKSNEILNRPNQSWGLVESFSVQLLEVWPGQRVYWDAFWASFALGHPPQEAYP